MTSKMWSLLLVLILLVSGSNNGDSWPGDLLAETSSEKRLIQDLLDHSKYDKRARPVRNQTEAVAVTIRFNLYQMLDVNEVNQNIELYLWVTQTWTDKFLGWDPNKYGGMTQVALPFEDVWLPDTYVYNSLEMARTASERWINVIATTQFNETTGIHEASIKFQYPAIFKFSCSFNIFYFPFDVQNCTLEIGSWTYDSSGLDYFPHGEKVLTEAFIPNEEWELVSFKFSRSSLKYLCCPYPYTWVNAHLVIERKPLYYMANLITPTSVICLIAIFGFFMPATTTGDRTEKVNLGITTLLAMSILLLMVSDQMPRTSNYIPIIGWYFLTIIGIISLGTLTTSLIIVVQKRGYQGQPVGRYMHFIFFDVIAKILFMKPSQRLIMRRKQAMNEAKAMGAVNAENESLKERSLGTPLIEKNSQANQNKSAEKLTGNEEIIRQILQVRFTLQKMEEFMTVNDRRTVSLLEYEYLSLIMDRFLLIVFTLAVACCTASILFVGVLFTQRTIKN